MFVASGPAEPRLAACPLQSVLVHALLKVALAVCVDARTCLPWVLPPGPFACFGCFVFFLLLSPPPRVGKHTLAPSVLPEVFLPFEGIRWVGKMLQECRPSPGNWLLFQLIIEQRVTLFVFRPWSQAAAAPFPLFVPFSTAPVGWEQRQCAWGLCVEAVQMARPLQSCLLLVLRALMKGLGEGRGLGAGAGGRVAPGPEPSCPGAPGSRAQLQGASACPWQQICEPRLPFWISG